MAGKPKFTLYCSFCGKSEHEVRKLIAGPTVFICDECIVLCLGICREHGFDPLAEPSNESPVTAASIEERS